MQEQASNTTNSLQHPLVKGKNANAKVSVSSSNLEDSIGGIIGNKIQTKTGESRHGKERKQGNYGFSKNNAISPNIARK